MAPLLAIRKRKPIELCPVYTDIRHVLDATRHTARKYLLLAARCHYLCHSDVELMPTAAITHWYGSTNSSISMPVSALSRNPD
jgi:hypothetical protein